MKSWPWCRATGIVRSWRRTSGHELAQGGHEMTTTRRVKSGLQRRRSTAIETCLFRVVLFMLEQKKECSATDALEEAQEHFREAADFGQPEAQSCMGTLLFRKTFGGVTTGGRSLRCEKRSTLWLLFALRWRSTFNSRMPQRGVSSLNWRCLGNGLSNAEREKKVSPVVEGAVAVCDKTCAQAKDAIFLLDWHSGSSGRGARGTALWLLKREP
jgi:hypothetical protein